MTFEKFSCVIIYGEVKVRGEAGRGRMPSATTTILKVENWEETMLET